MTQRNKNKNHVIPFTILPQFNPIFGSLLSDVRDFKDVPFANPEEIRHNVQLAERNRREQVYDRNSGEVGKSDHSSLIADGGEGAGENPNLSSSSERSSRGAGFGVGSSSKSNSNNGGSGDDLTFGKVGGTRKCSGRFSVFQRSSSGPEDESHLGSAIEKNSRESEKGSHMSSRREENSEEEERLMYKLMEFDDEPEAMDPRNQMPSSPVKVDKLVFQVLKRLDNENGVSCRCVKRYLGKNCDVNVDAIYSEIKECLHNGLMIGTLVRVGDRNYRLPLPPTPPKRSAFPVRKNKTDVKLLGKPRARKKKKRGSKPETQQTPAAPQ